MRSIRATLTLWYTVALTATVFAFGITVTLRERQASFRALDQRLTQTAAPTAATIEEEYRENHVLIDESFDPLVAVATVALQRRLDPVPGYVILVDSAARGIYGSAEVRRFTPQAGEQLRNRVFALTAPTEAFTLDLDHTTVRFVAQRIRGAGPAIIAVAVGERTGELEVAPAQLVSSMLIVAPIIILFGLLTGLWLSGRALLPVRSMIDELEAISDGRSLHRRLPSGGMDPDEIGRLANALNALLARLEASFSALRRFVADASHELKTPLMVMRAGVERALTDPGTDPQALAPLDETLQGVRRMTELVEALLTLARVDEGRLELHREAVDLVEALREVHETAQILGEAAGVDVRLDLPDEPVLVDGDRARLRQLIMNLSENAVKYTAAGGAVWLTLSAAATSVSISVRDSGIGIAPGDVGRVFDRFWRADPARSRTGDRPGIGLGLSICKWIAEAHGGSIGVTSRPGRGSTFTVTLPRAAVAGAVIES